MRHRRAGGVGSGSSLGGFTCAYLGRPLITIGRGPLVLLAPAIELAVLAGPRRMDPAEGRKWRRKGRQGVRSYAARRNGELSTVPQDAPSAPGLLAAQLPDAVIQRGLGRRRRSRAGRGVRKAHGGRASLTRIAKDTS